MTNKAFDPESVAQPGFSLKAALSLAQVSQLAYLDSGSKLKEELEASGMRLIAATGWTNPFSQKASQGLVLETDDRVILAFRGSSEGRDWGLNLKIGQVWWSPNYAGRVHNGFATGLRLVWGLAIERLVEQVGSGKPLVVTGHSLGGALAMLAAYRLGPERVTSIYTFGQPLAGNGKFCRAFDERFSGRYFRVVNHKDIVARIPPRPLYQHTGALMKLTKEGEIKEPRVRAMASGGSGGPMAEMAEMEEGEDAPMTMEEFKAYQKRSKGPQPEAMRGIDDHSLAGGYIPKLTRLVEREADPPGTGG